MTSKSDHAESAPQQTQPQPQPGQSRSDTLWLLTTVLVVVVGIPVARYVVAAIWPDLDSTWGTIAVNAAVVGACGAIIALIMRGAVWLSDRVKASHPRVRE